MAPAGIPCGVAMPTCCLFNSGKGVCGFNACGGHGVPLDHLNKADMGKGVLDERAGLEREG